MADDKDKEKYKKWLKEQDRLLSQLQQLIYNNCLLSLNIAGVKKAISSGNDGFFFVHNTAANNEVDKLFANMAKQMDYLLLNGIKREWKQSEENFWDKLELAFSKTARDKKAFDQIREQATQSSRDKTAQSFYNKKRDGLSVSERVWNLSGNAKKEMEIIIQNGIKEGKSAEDIQKSLKNYLKEPDKLFRRVRNKETGELELSRAAQKYNPGQGVYRSAYKNAMRLARTEMKAANCEAAWNAAQNNPLITGWHIVLSNNHTTLINGVPVPFKDICDDLQGVYPKTFKFTGWHPMCRCEMLPITITKTESKELYKNIFDGKRDEWKPEQITKVPKEFTEWVQQNQERAKGWKNMPRFIKDNAQFVKPKFDANTYTAEEKKFTQAHKTREAMQRVIEKLAKLYPDIPSTELAAIHHYTKSGGNYRQLNRQLENGTLTEFNKASKELIISGLNKLPKHEGYVYRGMIIKRKDMGRLFDGEKGTVIKQNRFISSSMNVNVAREFNSYKELKKNEAQVFFEIYSKNGRDISRISEKNGNFDMKNQEEVLFLNNTPFELLDKYTDANGVIYIKMKEI